MTRLTWFECLILLSFWLGGLTAFLVGGMAAVGQLLKVLLVVVLWWVLKELYREYFEELRNEYDRHRICRERRENSRRKGME